MRVYYYSPDGNSIHVLNVSTTRKGNEHICTPNYYIARTKIATFRLLHGQHSTLVVQSDFEDRSETG